MIISEQFVWLHLPKTGGTSVAQKFKELNIDHISVDDETTDSKHDSWQYRNAKSDNISKRSINKLTIITSRRLAAWLLSDWHHKTIKMGLQLPFEPVKSGLFYSLRLGGVWVSADYWIRYFDATNCDHVIRLENLEEDSNRVILPLLPKTISSLQFDQKNGNDYFRNLEIYFGDKELKRIYENNPEWSKWEEKIYGNHASINNFKRLAQKVKTFSRQ